VENGTSWRVIQRSITGSGKVKKLLFPTLLAKDERSADHKDNPLKVSAGISLSRADKSHLHYRTWQDKNPAEIVPSKPL